MQKYLVQLDLNPSDSSLDQLSAGIADHSASFVDQPGFQPMALFARDSERALRGGIYGRINWSWLSISLLWVHPDDRGSGLGATLLNRLEEESMLAGCTKAHVDTFSFQAREFYLGNGYEKFAELPNYPEGHSRIYLRKSLSIAAK